MVKRFVFVFSPEIVNKPFVSNIVKHYDVDINILNADVTSGREGKLVVDLSGDDENVEKALEYVSSHGVVYAPVVKQLQFRQEACVNCGSCTAVCFSGALTMDPETWELVFKPEECVVCGRCVKACPLQLFTIDGEM